MEYAAAHVQHMQKALMEMNLQLHHVVSDVTGATGIRIIRAIVAGERNPDVLATYRDVRCHSSIETIRAALGGNNRDEHIFALTELYDCAGYLGPRWQPSHAGERRLSRRHGTVCPGGLRGQRVY